MKYVWFALSLGTLAAAMTSLSVCAQTCAAPATFQAPPSGGSVAGTTCGGDTTAAGYCGGNLDAPGPAFVFQINLDGVRVFNNFSLIGGAGYDAVMYVSPTSGGCGTNAACTATGDTGAPIPSGDIPDGSYYLIVTAATFDGPGSCGTFTLSTDGNIPVELQSFTIS